MRWFLLVGALAASAVTAATYLNGVETPMTITFNGEDIRVVTDGTPPPVTPPDPVEPPEPPVLEGCPTAGRVPLTLPLLDLTTQGPQIEITSTGITGGWLIGNGDDPWHVALGMRPGSAGDAKWLGVFSCPIFTEEYLVQNCVATGSSTIALKARESCKLETGKRYFWLYGNPKCTDATCRAVRNLYGVPVQ